MTTSILRLALPIADLVGASGVVGSLVKSLEQAAEAAAAAAAAAAAPGPPSGSGRGAGGGASGPAAPASSETAPAPAATAAAAHDVSAQGASVQQGAGGAGSKRPRGDAALPDAPTPAQSGEAAATADDRYLKHPRFSSRSALSAADTAAAGAPAAFSPDPPPPLEPSASSATGAVVLAVDAQGLVDSFGLWPRIRSAAVEPGEGGDDGPPPVGLFNPWQATCFAASDVQVLYALAPMRKLLMGLRTRGLEAAAADCPGDPKRAKELRLGRLVAELRALFRLMARQGAGPRLAAVDPSRFLDAAAAVLNLDDPLWMQVRVGGYASYSPRHVSPPVPPSHPLQGDAYEFYNALVDTLANVPGMPGEFASIVGTPAFVGEKTTCAACNYLHDSARGRDLQLSAIDAGPGASTSTLTAAFLSPAAGVCKRYGCPSGAASATAATVRRLCAPAPRLLAVPIDRRGLGAGKLAARVEVEQTLTLHVAKPGPAQEAAAVSYDLHAVVVQHGNARGGHSYAFLPAGKWCVDDDVAHRTSGLDQLGREVAGGAFGQADVDAGQPPWRPPAFWFKVRSAKPFSASIAFYALREAGGEAEAEAAAIPADSTAFDAWARMFEQACTPAQLRAADEALSLRTADSTPKRKKETAAPPATSASATATGGDADGASGAVAVVGADVLLVTFLRAAVAGNAYGRIADNNDWYLAFESLARAVAGAVAQAAPRGLCKQLLQLVVQRYNAGLGGMPSAEGRTGGDESRGPFNRGTGPFGSTPASLAPPPQAAAATVDLTRAPSEGDAAAEEDGEPSPLHHLVAELLRTTSKRTRDGVAAAYPNYMETLRGMAGLSAESLRADLSRVNAQLAAAGASAADAFVLHFWRAMGEAVLLRPAAPTWLEVVLGVLSGCASGPGALMRRGSIVQVLLAAVKV